MVSYSDVVKIITLPRYLEIEDQRSEVNYMPWSKEISEDIPSLDSYLLIMAWVQKAVDISTIGIASGQLV